MTTHSPTTAFVLSLLLPGLGLLYLSRKKAGLLNFLLVNAVLLVVVLAFGMLEHIHYVFLGLAAMSAGYAHYVARTVRQADVH